MSPTSRPAAGRWLRAGAALGTTTLLLSVATIPADAGPRRTDNTSAKLRAAVTEEGLAEHLEAFQAIADAHDGNRASGTEGYDASAAYVMDVLTDAGYEPTVQEFEFPYFTELAIPELEQISPLAKAYTTPDDFMTMSYSGSGDVTGQVVAVDTTFTPPSKENPVTSGCEADDFVGFPAGSIALMQRGGCTFGTKALNAQNAGAVAAIVFNTGAEGATDAFGGTLGAPETPVTIPVVGSSFAVGQELDGSTARVFTSTFSEYRTTFNVLAETAAGSDDNVVVVGAHLDSVEDGPGINDNGTGSAGILEVAEQMAEVKPKNKVRFAWWGAEESGLLGAEHYVADLEENDPAALEAIALYLNFDMIGSPNFVRFVYDGDNSRYGTDVAMEGPAGSGAIEQTFHDYFASQDLPSEESAFTGRSDYGPFISVGIPAGGLFTGGDGTKTPEQQLVYGGTAGITYDECYHTPCDDIDNVDRTVLHQMSDAIAHTVLTFAMSTQAVNGEGKGHPVAAPGQAVAGEPTGTGSEDAGLHAHEHTLPAS